MAFPTLATQATTATSNTSSKAMTMPASIVATNLLVCTVSTWATGITASMTGWTPLFTFFINNGVGLGAWGKIAAGSDTGTVTLSGAADITGFTYQFSGWSGDLNDVLAATFNAGLTAAAPNPPSLAVPSAADYIWLALGSTASAPTYTAPASYSNLLQSSFTNGKMCAANRSLNAASEDPGAFGGSGNVPVAATIAIPPVLATYIPNGWRRRHSGLLAR